MNYKLFFAYQSDIPDKYNKGFIHSALALVVNRLIREGVRLEVDFGFRGTPGTPLLIEEMLKKSYDADIVLVDLTFTSSKKWHMARKFVIWGREIRLLDSTKDKFSSNPNVLLETGFAWANKGTYRTLAIMNEAFGTPADLCVDLQGFRWGITYSLNDSNYKERKKERNELSENLYKAITASIRSEASHQRKKWSPLLIFQDWNSPDFAKPYKAPDELRDTINKLRTALKVAGNPQRLIGPKNSGKTRLARELYNYIDDSIPKDDSLEKVLYYDLDLTGYQSIEKAIIELGVVNQDKILILDNCPFNIHKRVCDQLYESNVRILSIDKEMKDKTVDGATVRITPELAKKVVEVVVNEKFSGETSSLVIEYSDGNIREALVYVTSNIGDSTEIETEYEMKWKQLLGKEFDKGALQVLEILSLFTHVGISSRYSIQADFIRSQCGNMDRVNFEQLLDYFSEKGMLKIQGDFVILETFVAELASSWFKNKDINYLMQFFEEVKRVSLSRAFGNQFIKLAGQSGADNIVKTITNSESAFNYEFINSREHSQLIISLAEIAPKETIDWLTRCFKDKNIEMLLLFREGRRNTVWALERLCFRNETFIDSAKLLYRLALAENEEIGNNATYQFGQLFQAYLGGTEASLRKRFKLLIGLYKIPGTEVLFRAFSRALQAANFHRDSGADIQAGVELRDYRPKATEVLSYWANIINFLLEMDGEDQKKAEDILLSKLTQQYSEGNKMVIHKALVQIIKRRDSLDYTIRQHIVHLTSERFSLLDIHKSDLLKLMEAHEPKDTTQLINLKVTSAPYQSIRKNGGFVDVAAENARELAKELIASNDFSWTGELINLQRGEQRQGYNFADEVGKQIEDASTLVDQTIGALSTISIEEQNEIFLVGLLSGVNDEDFTRQTIDKIISVPAIKQHSVRMTRLLIPKIEDLRKLIPLISEKPDYVMGLQYLKYENLSNDDIIEFLSWMNELNSTGTWLAIDIIQTLVENDDSKFGELQELIIKLVSKKGLLLEDKSGHLSLYNFELLVSRLVKIGIPDDLVVHFIGEIQLVCTGIVTSSDFHLKSILHEILESYWDLVWSIIGEILLDTSHDAWYGLKTLLKGYKRFDHEDFWKWVEENQPKAPVIVMTFLEFEGDSTENRPTWNPVVKRLLDNHGSNIEFLQELSARIHSWGAIGSAFKIFQDRKYLVELLIDHPNADVRSFAKREIEYFESLMEREDKFWKNQDLGELF